MANMNEIVDTLQRITDKYWDEVGVCEKRKKLRCRVVFPDKAKCRVECLSAIEFSGIRKGSGDYRDMMRYVCSKLS